MGTVNGTETSKCWLEMLHGGLGLGFTMLY